MIRRANPAAVAAIFVCALLSAQLSWRLRAPAIDFMFAAQLSTLEGRPLNPEFQNRVLTPVLLRALRSQLPSAISNAAIWRGLRFAQGLLAYLAIYFAAFALTNSVARSIAAIVLVAYAYVWTPMTLAWELPSDFFDMAFIAIAAVFAVRLRLWWLVALVFVAAFNRESAAFGGVLWICSAVLVARRGWAFTWLPGLGLIALTAAIVLTLRATLSGQAAGGQQVGILTMLEHPQWLIHPTGSGPMLLATALPFAAGLARMAKPWRTEQRALVAAAAVTAMITVVFGITSELRVWLPCWVMLALALSMANFPRVQNILD